MTIFTKPCQFLNMYDNFSEEQESLMLIDAYFTGET
jgi:hypothetical protein